MVPDNGEEEGPEDHPNPIAEPGRPDSVTSELLRRYVAMAALEKLQRHEKCALEEVEEAAKRAAKKLKITVSKKRCTQAFRWLAEQCNFLGITIDPNDDRTLQLEQAVVWYKKSRMFGRLYEQYALKQKVAKLVADELKTFGPSSVAYFDAGSTTLHCAREFRPRMSQWTVLTNNLLLASELIHGDPKPRCYLAAGQADLETAAIVESNPEDFKRWLIGNRVQVSVVSFHWLLANPETNELVFVADLPNEERSKALAVQCAQECVIIPLTTDKFQSIGEQKRQILKYHDGKWTSLLTSPADAELALKRVIVCIDKKPDRVDEPYRSVLKKMQERVEVRFPG